MFIASAAPVVSVLIPTYNCAKYLDETIQSVLNQTFTDFEIVVVDNCSDDDTGILIQKYLSDKRIKYYLNDTNIGMAGNWNKAMKYASGKYIKFLMSDDKFHPDLLSKFVAILDKHSNVSLVSSYRYMFGAENWRFETPLSELQNGLEAAENSMLSHNWIGEPTTVMFRSSHLWLGDFKTELQYYIDWEFWLRLLKNGDLYVVPECLSYFRIHEEQGTSRIKKNYIDVFETYYILIFFQSFNFADFVNKTPFNLEIRKAAQKCVDLIPALRTANNVALLERAREIGRRENVKPPTVLDRAVSKLKRYVSK